MSIGNPDKGYCPACGKGITEPATICDHYKKWTFDECNGCSGDCEDAKEGVKCPRCGFLAKDE